MLCFQPSAGPKTLTFGRDPSSQNLQLPQFAMQQVDGGAMPGLLGCRLSGMVTARPLTQDGVVHRLSLRLSLLAHEQPPHRTRSALAPDPLCDLRSRERRQCLIAAAAATARLGKQDPGVGLAARRQRGNLRRIVEVRPHRDRQVDCFMNQCIGTPPVGALGAQARCAGHPALRTRRRPALCLGGLLRLAAPRRSGPPCFHLVGDLGVPGTDTDGLEHRPLPQALLERGMPGGGAGTGELRVDLSSHPRPHRTPLRRHRGASRAVAAGIQPDPVVAPPVPAQLALDQATPEQPGHRLAHQSLAAGLGQAVGQTVSEQLRRGLGVQEPGQHANCLFGGPPHDGLLTAAEPVPQSGYRGQRHRQTKIIQASRPSLSLRPRLAVHDRQPNMADSRVGRTSHLNDREPFRLFPAKRASQAVNLPQLLSGKSNHGPVLVHARALRPTTFPTTAFAGKPTRERERRDVSTHSRVISVKGCRSVGLCHTRLIRHPHTADLRFCVRLEGLNIPCRSVGV